MQIKLSKVDLTKSYIESKVSQELIISTYLDIPLEVVHDCVTNNHLIKSVFRDDDTNKSMGISYNKKGRLKVRDFGGFGFFEDVYGTVAYVLSLGYGKPIDTNIKSDFYFVLQHIANTFSNYIYGNDVDTTIGDSIKIALSAVKKHRPVIEIVERQWEESDRKLWAKWNVDLQYLNTHFVIPVDQYYIDRQQNSSPKYNYNKKDPCYAYLLGQSNNTGIYFIKLYFPLRDRSRELKFITNATVLEGVYNLELDNYDYIIITKSSKDRLSLGSYLSKNTFYGGAGDILKIGVINLPSEKHIMTNLEYNWLKNKLNDNGILISLLDFDTTGRCGAKYLKETYDIPYLFITRGEFGLNNYKAKDFSDLHDHYTVNEISNFIKQTIDYVRNKRKDGTYAITTASSTPF